MSPHLGFIGLAPTAAPLCTTLYPGYPSNAAKCPPDTNAFPVVYGGASLQGAPVALCASLPVNNDTKLRPAVGAYYAIATSGEMLLSAPVAGGTESGQGVPPVCPAL